MATNLEQALRTAEVVRAAELITKKAADGAPSGGAAAEFAKKATVGMTMAGAVIGISGVAGAEKPPEEVTIQQGDTLSTAVAYHNAKTGHGHTLREVMDINDDMQNPDVVHPGERVFLESTHSQDESVETYEVRAGDTMSDVAYRFGLSLDDLKAANPQIENIHKIYPGDRVNVTVSARAANPLEVPVYRGDQRVADNNHVLPGDVVRLPNGAQHVIERGDTVSGVLARGGTVTQQAAPSYRGARVYRSGSPVINPHEVLPGDQVVTAEGVSVEVRPGDTVDAIVRNTQSTSDSDEPVTSEPVSPAAERTFENVTTEYPSSQELNTPEFFEAIAERWRTEAADGVYVENKIEIFKAMIGQGVPLPAAAGMMGNAFGESRYDSGVEERTTRQDKGYGIFQWTFERRASLEAEARERGVAVSDPVFQTIYAIEESQNRDQRGSSDGNEWSGLIVIQDPVEAAQYFKWHFERPNHHLAHDDVRIAEAQDVFGDVLEAWALVAEPQWAEETTPTPEVVAPGSRPETESAVEGEVHAAPRPEFVPGLPVEISDGNGEPGTNGNLDPSMLVDLGGRWQGHRLQPAAAEAFLALNHRFKQHFGYDIDITDSYRPYADQVDVKRRKGRMAAQPGTSKHGCGLALDLGTNINSFESDEYKWMMENAPQYGFVNPPQLRDGQGVEEPWHWSFGPEAG